MKIRISNDNQAIRCYIWVRKAWRAVYKCT